MSDRDYLRRGILVAMISAMLIISSAAIQLVIAQSPRQSSPEVVRQMERQAYPSQVAVAEQLARMDQHITDLEKRIDLHRIEIDAMDPAKTNGRIVTIENALERARQEKEQADASTTAHWNEVMAWVRGIGLLIATMAINEGRKRFTDKRRRASRDLTIDGKLDLITTHTDGMVERISALSHAAGVTEGHKEEIENPTTD